MATLPFRLLLPFNVLALVSSCGHAPAARDTAANSTQPTSTATDSTLGDTGKIDLATARRTALAKVPSATVLSEELEQEGGRSVYSFDLRRPSVAGVEEVQVDAHDGSVVSVKHESPTQESHEAQEHHKNR